MPHQRQKDHDRHSRKTQHRCHHQTVRPPDKKPQQRPNNLPAIQRINRQHIENQYDEIRDPNRPQKFVPIRMRVRPMQEMTAQPKSGQHYDQRHVHQRSRRDAPQHRAWALRRCHVSHAAQRPEHDKIRFSADLPASQRMSKFVHEHNYKQGNENQNRPRKGASKKRRENPFAKKREKQPVPGKININPEQSKYSYGTSPRRHVDLSHGGYRYTSFLAKNGPADAVISPMQPSTFLGLLEEMIDIKVQQHTEAHLKTTPEVAAVLLQKRQTDKRRIDQIRAELLRIMST